VKRFRKTVWTTSRAVVRKGPQNSATCPREPIHGRLAAELVIFATTILRLHEKARLTLMALPDELPDVSCGTGLRFQHIITRVGLDDYDSECHHMATGPGVARGSMHKEETCKPTPGSHHHETVSGTLFSFPAAWSKLNFATPGFESTPKMAILPQTGQPCNFAVQFTEAACTSRRHFQCTQMFSHPHHDQENRAKPYS